MDVLKSKSFWSSVAVILSMVLVSVAPDLQGHQDELISAFTAIGVALVAGHKIKDIALAFADALLNRTSLADELNEINQS